MFCGWMFLYSCLVVWPNSKELLDVDASEQEDRLRLPARSRAKNRENGGVVLKSSMHF